MSTDIHIRLGAEAQAIAETLIPLYHDHLAEVKILYIFTSQKRKKGGHVVLGTAQKANPLLRFLSRRHLDEDTENPQEADFIMLLSSVEWLMLDDKQRRALVDHELCHMAGEYDDATQEWTWRLRGHDVEEFTEIIERHGLWKKDLKDFGQAVKQPSLFREVSG